MRLRRRLEGAAAGFATAGKPSAKAPWRAARWCAIDLEMTGLDFRTDEIIAIGAVPIEEGRIVLGEALYSLVRTSKPSARAAVLVHKLRVADLAEAPPLGEAMDRLLTRLAGRVPVFHTASIERRFLERRFRERGVRLPHAADTEALGRLWLRRRDGRTPDGLPLARLARELGQPGEVPHHALGDALTTAQAFIALASLLDVAEPQTVGTLLSAPDQLRMAGPV